MIPWAPPRAWNAYELVLSAAQFRIMTSSSSSHHHTGAVITPGQQGASESGRKTQSLLTWSTSRLGGRAAITCPSESSVLLGAKFLQPLNPSWHWSPVLEKPRDKGHTDTLGGGGESPGSSHSTLQGLPKATVWEDSLQGNLYF